MFPSGGRGGGTVTLLACGFASRRALAVLGRFVLADALDADDTFALGRIEDDDALRAAAGDADALDRAADHLAAIGDEHDFVAVLDRHGGDERPVARD